MNSETVHMFLRLEQRITKIEKFINSINFPTLKEGECEHESDGIRYSSVCEGMTQFKCKKCGEFYR